MVGAVGVVVGSGSGCGQWEWLGVVGVVVSSGWGSGCDCGQGVRLWEVGVVGAVREVVGSGSGWGSA